MTHYAYSAMFLIFAVPLTFGRVMNMELLIFSGKHPFWYIIFVKLVGSVSSASPGATSSSVKMLLVQELCSASFVLEQTLLLFW